VLRTQLSLTRKIRKCDTRCDNRRVSPAQNSDGTARGRPFQPGRAPVIDLCVPKWVRELRDVCREQQVPFFFKQWDGIRSKAGGRELDGKFHSQLPCRTPRTLRAVLA
jgi:Protein of unknown function (DUF5131)